MSSSPFRVSLTVAASTLVFSACGQERADPDVWMPFGSPTARYTLDLPGDPAYSTIPGPTGDIQMWSIERDDDLAMVADTPLSSGQPFDLDAGVIGAAEAMRVDLSRQVGRDIGLQIVERSERTVGSLGGRYVRAVVDDGDVRADVYVQIFMTTDAAHQVTVVDVGGDTPEFAERVFGSIAVNQ